ncbi:helix-turn-helix domain-containing protein (plasmid) [Borreliella californiensis]|uniref:Helix-turn-helix domain-containing protein n=1 Tax=Borreliella californiensis TaxID=373543 RepID=A0ABZ3JD28_9SPIR
MSDNKAYKYRIYSNTNQKKFFKSIWMCKILYSKMLSDRMDYYEKNK